MNIKHIAFLGFTFLSCTSSMLGQQVGINTTNPDNSAYLDISGTSKGLLPPRLNAVDRFNLDATGPANGLVVYNTDDESLQVNKGTKETPNWVSLGKVVENPTLIPDKKETWMYFPVVPLAMYLLGKNAFNTLNLYDLYVENLATPLGLTYTKDQLEFFVVDYDKNAFNMAEIIDNDTPYMHTLLYMPVPAKVTDATYINIVIKIKQ